MTLLKWGGAALALYFLSNSDVVTSAEAQVSGCPPGTFAGPWFTCVPACGSDEFVAFASDGHPYCAHHGGVTLMDDAGNALAAVSAAGQQLIFPDTGPITSPDDPRLNAAPITPVDAPITSPHQVDPDLI